MLLPEAAVQLNLPSRSWETTNRPLASEYLLWTALDSAAANFGFVLSAFGQVGQR